MKTTYDNLVTNQIPETRNQRYFYHTRSDEIARRNKLISQSKTNFCVFEITKFPCRNVIHKTDTKEGIYCGLLRCNCTKNHDRDHNRMNRGQFFIHKDRIKNYECEYLFMGSIRSEGLS